MTWTMPPEWTPHKRTWMAWPCNPDVMEFVGSPDAAYRAWSGAANTIARFEPVTMVCNPGEEATARKYLDGAVSIVERELGDSWMRDCGPTFVVDGQGALPALEHAPRAQDAEQLHEADQPDAANDLQVGAPLRGFRV